MDAPLSIIYIEMVKPYSIVHGKITFSISTRIAKRLQSWKEPNSKDGSVTSKSQS